MNDFVIREIKSTDYKDIYLLNQEFNPKLCSFSAERVKERIDYIVNNTKDIIFLSEQGNEVIGYIHGSPYELLYEDSLINVLGFVVKEQYRNLGVGNMLMEGLEFWAKEKDFYGTRLVSGSDRLNAHKFYEKHGYVSRKNQKNFIKMFR